MRAGMPSINPRGRPRVGDSLAAAVRASWPPEKLVELATRLAASEDESIAMRALEWLSDRSAGKVATSIDLTARSGDAVDRPLAGVETEELEAELARLQLAAGPS